jgi:predicted pyridoxine 5'-phosphate oxidase superfamily flavin-nucleotide-binding protein
MTENERVNPTSAASGMERVAKAWEDREGPAVFVTVEASQVMPNAIYVGEIRYIPEKGFIIADNYFSKTRENIKKGTNGAILFLTKERKSFQVKGTLTRHTQGSVFENMQSWHDPKHPGVAAVLLRVEEAYSGAEVLYRLSRNKSHDCA